MSEWHRDDEFWAAIEPVILDPARLARAVDEAAAVASLAGVGPGARVLDLCCGPGTHAIELARRGCVVTGVDRTRRYLARAAERAAAAGVEVEWVEADMLEFVRPGAYDAAFSLWTSFGYFEDDADNLRVAAQVRRSLAPGGRFVVDVLGKEVFARDLQARRWTEIDGVLSLEERIVRDGWTHLDSRWIVVRDGRRVDLRSVQRLYSAGELTALLRAAGFCDARCHGSLEGAPYDDLARMLVTIATA